MKLLKRTTYTYLLLTIPIIAIGMLVFYVLIKNFNLQHVENNLKEEHNKIINKSQKIKNYFIEDELSEELLVREIPKDSVIEDTYSTVMMFDHTEKQNEPFRQLVTTQVIAGKNYKITIRKSLVEKTSLLYSISIAVFLLILFISISFILLNRLLSEKLWSPFYSILKNLSQYHIGNSYKRGKTYKTEEFQQLDGAISMMIDRVNREFFIHKEFIDIVSHEYQTPLAVIGNEAEMLLQNEHLTESDAQKISRIIEYVRRLSKMNKSLLLLSRIDNNQYEQKEEIIVSTFLANRIDEKQLQFEMKNIVCSTHIEENTTITFNPLLAEILINNLLQNAIRHNFDEGGVVDVYAGGNSIRFVNTSNSEAIDGERLYKKFSKSDKNKNSIGLGLNIVKAICDHYNVIIQYTYQKESKQHSFELRFPS